MDEFTKAYIECLKWVRQDEEFVLTSQDLDQIEADCKRFQACAARYLSKLDATQCGNDFYLARNGEGEGFLGRGYDKKIAKALYDIANEFGASYEAF